MKKEVKAIIFDYNGVLTLGKPSPKSFKGHHTFSFHEYMSKKLKISLDKWFDAIDSTYAKSIEGQISPEKTIKTISNNLRISEKMLIQLIKKSYKRNFNDNKELLKKLKLLNKKYKLAILSDQWILSYEALVNKKYLKYFDVKIFSHEVGMRKPNPKIYKLVLQKLKLKPQETIFIDDRGWNLKPAKELGINTIQFKNNKQLFKQLSKFGVDV